MSFSLGSLFSTLFSLKFNVWFELYSLLMSFVLCFVLFYFLRSFKLQSSMSRKKPFPLFNKSSLNLFWSPFVVAFPSLCHSLLLAFFLTLNLIFIYLFMLFTWWWRMVVVSMLRDGHHSWYPLCLPLSGSSWPL